MTNSRMKRLKYYKNWFYIMLQRCLILVLFIKLVELLTRQHLLVF